MKAPQPLPTTVLTGFLGSGKTTLLRCALKSPALFDTAVVINEIGEVGIDHYLVDFVDGDVLELPGGCLCCALREDLAQTLRSLLQRRETGAIRRFGRVVVETTGLADPAPILYTLGADPMLDEALAPAQVVTLVDALAGAQTLDRFAEAGRQVAVADRIAVSKTDLAPLSPALAARLDALNPAAPRVFTAEIADPSALLFAAAAPRTPAGPQGPAAIHSHGIETFAIALNGGISRLDFARALGGLARERGSDLLRVKGILRFSDRPERPAVVQGAQHAIFAPEWLDRWPDADARSRLVFIVHGIPRAAILERFASARPVPWSAAGAPPSPDP